MRPASAGLIAGLLSVAAPTVHAAQGSYVYTTTHGASCADRSREGFSRWRCPGPAGYVAEYTDEGNIAGNRPLASDAATAIPAKRELARRWPCAR